MLISLLSIFILSSCKPTFLEKYKKLTIEDLYEKKHLKLKKYTNYMDKRNEENLKNNSNLENMSWLKTIIDTSNIDNVNKLEGLSYSEVCFIEPIFASIVLNKVEIFKKLYQNSIIQSDEEGNNILHYIAYFGRRKIAKEVIKLSRDSFVRLIDESNNIGLKPIHVAAFKGKVEIMDLILSLSNKSLIEEDCFGNSCENLALSKGHKEVIESISLKKELTDYQSLLFYAILSNNKEIVNYVIKKLKIDDFNLKDNNPLMIAAQTGNKDILNFFLEKEMNILDLDKKSKNILFYAVKGNELDMLDTLLENKAIKNQKGYIDSNLLNYAVKKCDISVTIKKDNEDINVLNKILSKCNEETIKISFNELITSDEIKEENLLYFLKNIKDKLNNDELSEVICRAIINNFISIVEEFVNEKNVNNLYKEVYPIFIAVLVNNETVFDILVKKGAKLNISSSIEGKLCTLLDLAKDCFLYGVETIENDLKNSDLKIYFYKEDSNYNLRSKIKNTDKVINLYNKRENGLYPLSQGATKENLNIIDDKEKTSLNDDTIDSSKDFSLSLLRETSNGNKEKVKKLLNKNVDVNFKNNMGYTALMTASSQYYIKIVKILLNKNVDVNLKSNKGYTALMIASDKGHKEIVKLLLNENVNVNLQSNKGYTALMIASNKGHKEIVKLLLNKNVDVNLQNDLGYTALMIASNKGHKEIVKLLLNRNADVNLQNNIGYTALIDASIKGYKEIVELLLNKFANVDLQNRSRFTALMGASNEGHNETVKLLLNKNADINIQGNKGSTALIYSCQKGYHDIVSILLQNNANINLRNNKGMNALMVAIKYGFDLIVKELLTKNIDFTQKNQEGHTTMTILMDKITTHNKYLKIRDTFFDSNYNFNDSREVLSFLISKKESEVYTQELKTYIDKMKDYYSKLLIKKEYKVNSENILSANAFDYNEEVKNSYIEMLKELLKYKGEFSNYVVSYSLKSDYKYNKEELDKAFKSIPKNVFSEVSNYF